MKAPNRLRSWLPPMPTQPPAHAVNRPIILQLGLLVFIAVVFHFLIAQPAIAIFTSAIFISKTVMVLTNRKALNKATLITLTVISLTMVLLFYGGWNGQKAGISYLILLLALKFLESESLRDYCIVCLLLYFLASTSFLFNTEIISIVLVIIYTLGITSLLEKLINPIKTSWLDVSKNAFGLIAKAIPLTVLLFFFFPRISADIGFIPSLDEGEQTKQLNNSLAAGDFAAGAFNTNLAFRVEFDGQGPEQNKLYWRSKVMPIERNFKWHIAPTPPAELTRSNKEIDHITREANEHISYTILHSASKDNFIPYLDYVIEPSLGKQVINGSVFQPHPENATFSYRGTSINKAPAQTLAHLERQRLLAVNFLPTQRVRELLNHWQDQSTNQQQLVQTVFSHFEQNNFRYSLSPPALGRKPVDDFLFESKIGYCEHYAAVFTTLMRWLNIPARIVVGYQGGDYNNSGGFYEVRYSDAHAWSEVLLNGQWVRVDPTAAISPERIEFGMDALLAMLDENSMQSNFTGDALSNILNPTGYKKWLQLAKDNANNFGYQWDRWVINYDFDKQRELLSAMGIKHAQNFQTLTIILFSSCALLLMFYFLRFPAKIITYDKQQKLYLKFTQKFNKHGLVKELSETPNEFATKATKHFPHLGNPIQQITQIYVNLRYGSQITGDDTFKVNVNKFKRRVKQFKITKPNKTPIDKI